MKLEKWLWSASGLRANLEGSLAALLLLGSLISITRYLVNLPYLQGIVLVGALIPSVVGLRRRPVHGSRGQRVVIEVLQALCITAGLIGLNFILAALLGMEPEMQRLHQTVDLMVFLVSAGVYGFWRVFRWAWLVWGNLRRKSFAWSLTHAFIVLTAAMVLVMVMVVMLVLNLSHVELVREGAPGWVAVLAELTGFSFYVLLAAPFAIVPALLVLLPPMAGASYWVSRRITRRLDRLAQAAGRLSQGDWTVRVAPEGDDELARLQESFNRMAGELEKTNQALVEQRDRVAGLLRAQRELTASVSHELRTPVATSLIYLENDLERLDSLPVDTLRQDLGVALHEIHRLDHIIDDLFTLSKAEVNQLGLDLGAVDLKTLIEQTTAASARLAWESRRVRVQPDLPAGLPPVWADAGRVEQVLRNLLANGVRHTPPGGFVLVGAEVVDGGVRVAVTDTGEGIDPADLPHLWERFYRGSGEPGDGRSGLGLAIVKELVESMGGTVSVTSEPDQGSTFAFMLPCPSRAAGR